MNILQKIFKEHYEEMIYILHPRPTVIENVDKMINCGDSAFGGAMYGCTECGNLKFVAFRCHSRFCPTCGNHYSMERTTSMSFKLVNCPHRHCVFTIPKELRHFFLEDRNLLNCLFQAVQKVVLRMFFKVSKSENFVPGFVCVLHSFGRSLQLNPHIHCLISEGAAGNKTPWKPFKFFNYKFLRFAFRTVLLNLLEKSIGSSFKSIKSAIYKQCTDGFYVYAPPKKCDPKHAINYIGRYLGRPVISTKRIDNYDGDFVTFHYNRHEDDKLIIETIPVLDFMARLIQHIPEKHFKMIRYYGIYAKHHIQESKIYLAIPRQKHKILRSFNQWRNSIAASFGYDPLKCTDCGHTMTILEIYYNSAPLFEKHRLLFDSS